MAKKIDFKWAVLLESVKEPLRLVALAIIAWVLTAIIPQLDEKWIPILTLAFKFADKWVHEYKNANKSEGLWKGLIGF